MKSSITVICGHYGCGKTNLVLNLAAEAAQRGRRSVVVDMDVVNPYFRSSDYSALLKKLGVELIDAGVREHNARYPCAAAGDLLHL